MRLIAPLNLQRTCKMPKLTKSFAEKAPRAETGQEKYWDSEIKGFGLFCGKTTKAWYYQRDVGGKTKRVLIGRFPTISADAARKVALDLAVEHSRGRGRSAMARVPTLREAMSEYLSRPKLRSSAHKRNVANGIEKYLADWLDTPINEIDRRAVKARHLEISSKPVTANHVFQAFRSIYNHTRRSTDLPECPTSAIEWNREDRHQPVIKDLRAWQTEVISLENPVHQTFYKFLLSTGLRKSECAALQWADAKQKNVSGSGVVFSDRIVLPLTKNGRPFTLPIQPEHHRILNAVKSLDPVWVFPTWRGERAHLVAPQRISWSAHAHRRTFATIGVTLAGVPEGIVGRILNHTPESITGQAYAKLGHEDLRPFMAKIVTALETEIPCLYSSEL